MMTPQQKHEQEIIINFNRTGNKKLLGYLLT